MYKFVGPFEVISSKQKKTNKYKTKQTNQKYQKERQKPNMNAPFINLT
jgi:hypothetical protein